MLGAQVTRRKGGTISRRYRRNGYVLSQKAARRADAFATMQRPDKPTPTF
jgi:hypothetical protein